MLEFREGDHLLVNGVSLYGGALELFEVFLPILVLPVYCYIFYHHPPRFSHNLSGSDNV